MMDCLLFSAEAWQDMCYYMKAVKTEISGLGRFTTDHNGIPYISEIRILKQQAGGADFKIDFSVMDEFFNGMEDNERQEWQRCLFHFHTHPGNGTNPSFTDIENYKNMQGMFDLFIPFILGQDYGFNTYLYTSFPCKSDVPIPKIWIYELRKWYKKGPGKMPGMDKLNQLTYGPAMNFLIEMNNLGIKSDRKEWLDQEVAEKVQQSQYHPYIYTGYQQPKPHPDRIKFSTEKSKDDYKNWWQKWNDDRNTGYQVGGVGQNITPIQTKLTETNNDLPAYTGFNKSPHHMTKEELIEEACAWDFTWIDEESSFLDERDGKRYSIQDMKNELFQMYQEALGVEKKLNRHPHTQ